MYDPGGADAVRLPRPANEPGVAGANVGVAGAGIAGWGAGIAGAGIAGWDGGACTPCGGDGGLQRSQCHALRSTTHRAVVPHVMQGGAFTTHPSYRTTR